MEDGSIRIEEATEEALGTYTCVPYNALGTMGQSTPARLVLKVSHLLVFFLCVCVRACLRILQIHSTTLTHMGKFNLGTYRESVPGHPQNLGSLDPQIIKSMGCDLWMQ